MVHIYDVSAYVYAGMGTNFGSKAKYKKIPTGGIYNLMRAISTPIKKGEIVVLVFDSWTNAQSILPEYKGGRSRNPDVRFQVDLLYEYLKNVIPNCYKIVGYEADWLAASVFDEVLETTDASVIGWTVDADWAHNIVSTRTELMPASVNFGNITVYNFEKVNWDRHVKIPLNALTFSKVLFGDPSDNIPKLYYEGKYDVYEFFKIYCQYCKNEGLDNRQKSTAIEFIQHFKGYLGEELTEEAMKRIEVLYPRKVENRPSLSFNKINKDSLSKILSITGCKSLCKGLGIEFISDMGQLQEEVYEKYMQELGQTSKTRFFSELPTETVQIKDRGGFQ